MGASADGIGDTDVALARYNQDGSLDPGFGSGGIVSTNVAGRIRSTEWVRGGVLQPDGKIVVAGYTSTYGDPASSIALLRYNADGSPDETFGRNGITVTRDDSLDFMIHAVALQPDGKLIVAGVTKVRSSLGYVGLIGRYNSDGSIDTTFGGSGFVVNEWFHSVAAVALQGDGSIVIAGAREENASLENLSAVLVVARHLPDGRLDSGFAGTGVVVTEVGSEIGSHNSGSSIAIQRDGKIVVAGTSYSPSRSNDFALVRYNQNGSLDSTFGSGGKVTTDFLGESDLASAVAVLPNGKIVVVGESALSRVDDPFPYPGFYMAANIDFGIAVYAPNGALDSSFGVAGRVRTDFRSLTDIGRAVTVQSNGLIVVAGSSQTFENGDAYSSFAVARYTADGKLDPTFTSR